MPLHTLTGALPRIVVSETEELCLTNLATRLSSKDPTNIVARTLLAEMQRADIVPDSKVPGDVVRMNCEVEFEIDGSEKKCIRLVFPADADIGAGRLSILTPIGAALIGLSPRQSMCWRGHDGRSHVLKVLSVRNPGTA